MHLLKVLGPLEKLETRLSELYKRFSERFQNDAEASVFFYQMSVDEGAHADLVRFQRRQVTADPARFKEVDVDISEIEKILSHADLLLKSAERLTLEEAFEAAIGIESSAADQHYITAITLSNPDTARLFKSLTLFDGRHFLAVEDFARKRGFTFETKKSEHIQSSGPGEPEKEKRPDNEQTAPQRPVDIPQEFVDRINYVYTWHKSLGHYRFLGIRDYAAAGEIRQSYLRMAKEFHPDLHMDLPDDLKQKLNTIFSCINSAYSTLANPEKRKEYDRTLGARGRVK